MKYKSFLLISAFALIILASCNEEEVSTNGVEKYNTNQVPNCQVTYGNMSLQQIAIEVGIKHNAILNDIYDKMEYLVNNPNEVDTTTTWGNLFIETTIEHFDNICENTLLEINMDYYFHGTPNLPFFADTCTVLDSAGKALIIRLNNAYTSYGITLDTANLHTELRAIWTVVNSSEIDTISYLTVGSAVQVGLKSSEYWEANYDAWDDLLTNSNAFNKKGNIIMGESKNVKLADVKGAVLGLVPGAIKGSALMPGWGTALGALLGAVSGAVSGSAAARIDEIVDPILINILFP